MSEKYHPQTPPSTGQEEPLTREERWVLRWLVRMPLLRVADLSVCTQISQASLYRLLAHMQERGWVEAVSPLALSHRSCRCYYLSNRGLLRLALAQGNDPVVLAREAGADERGLLRLLPRLPALIAVQEVLWDLCLSAPEHLTYAGERSAIAWHALRDYTYEFQEAKGGHVQHCPVSALLLLRQRRMVPRYPDAMRQEQAEQQARESEMWYGLQLVLDSPLLTARAIRTWLLRLARVQAHRSWFPPLLILVAAPERMALWHAIMRHLLETEHVSLLPAVLSLHNADMWERATDAGGIWRRGWQRLGTQAPCHLHDLLLPVQKRNTDALLDSLLHVESLPEQQHVPTAVHEHLPPASKGITVPREKQPVLVRGHFTRRVADVLLHGDLQHLPITLASLSLSRQAIQLMTLIEQAPLLSTQEIAALLAQTVPSVARTLGHLATEGWVHRADRLLPGPRRETKARWVLSARGIRALALQFHLPTLPAMVASCTLTGEEIWLPKRASVLLHAPTWTHQQGLYTFFAHLARDTPTPSGVGLRWWSQEIGTRHYRWQAMPCLFSPDATAEVGNEEHSLRFWLEYLAGDPSMRDFTRRLKGYSTYLRSRAWMGEQRPLPVLCVLVEEPSYEQRLAHLLPRVQEHMLGCRVAVTTRSQVQARGGFSPIWWLLSPNAAEDRVGLLDL